MSELKCEHCGSTDLREELTGTYCKNCDTRCAGTSEEMLEEVRSNHDYLGDDDEEEETNEIVTDGGADDSEHMTDDDLSEAIESQKAPVSVAELRDIIADIQRDFEEWWDEHMDTVEDGNMTIVHEDGTVVVFADHTGHFWGDQLDVADVDDPETQSAVINAHHTAAKRLCDYSWSTASPVVVSKPNDFSAGTDLEHRHLMWLMNECGLSGGVALDQLMVEWHGLSQRQWSIRAGKDQGTVSQNLAKAKDKVIR